MKLAVFIIGVLILTGCGATFTSEEKGIKASWEFNPDPPKPIPSFSGMP